MARETVPSYCRFCFNACAMLVDLEDGRPVAVRGDKSNPIYQGYFCVKGQQLIAAQRHPERLLCSQKRGADGAFAPIPSAQAFDEIARQLVRIRERHGPRAIALYSGTYSTVNPASGPVATAWMKALGSRMAFNSNTIDQPGKALAQALHGMWMAPFQDFATSRVALLVGINPLVAMSGGIPQGNPGRFLSDALARGMQLIAIDPRRTETARRATLHLQPRPGWDAAIIAAFLHVILREQLQDAAFCTENVSGLAALRAAVEPFTPEWVAERADLPAAQIAEAARVFARAGRGVATAGTGPNMSGNGTLLEYLLLCLNTLCGRWLRAGERVANPGAVVPQFPAAAQAVGPWKAWGFGEKLRVRGFTNTAAGLPTTALADEILLDGDGQVRALINLGGNPVAAWPDQIKTIAAMKKLELLVQIDIKMSATAKLAHYLIAPRHSLEMAGITLNQDYLALYGVGFGYPEAYGQYTPAIAEPPPGSDVVEEWEFFYETAKRMGLSLELRQMGLVGPAKGEPVPLDMAHKPTSEEIFAILLRNARISFDELRRHPHGAVFPDPPVFVAPKQPGWQGRLEMGSAEMMDELARLAENASARSEPADYPLRLISRRMMTAYNSSARDLPALRAKWPYNPAFMHPAELARRGLAPGDVIEIHSDHAHILGVVEEDATLREGLISMSHSFGDAPERDADVRAIGANTGRLTSVERDYDRFSGLPRMSNIPVRIARSPTATPA
ncbi:MAG: molybdopterin dinucleotide-binding protein [Deltaproteobacteria bacterium]|nr:MAG: molybdopterin dinucleotide-binding protein [Deltaproteobacteria bacterium]